VVVSKNLTQGRKLGTKKVLCWVCMRCGTIITIGGWWRDLDWLDTCDVAEGREKGARHILFSGHYLHPFHSLRHGIARLYHILGNILASHSATYWHICLSSLLLHRRAFLVIADISRTSFVSTLFSSLFFWSLSSVVRCCIGVRISHQLCHRRIPFSSFFL
jgi:hypothetical protein